MPQVISFVGGKAPKTTARIIESAKLGSTITGRQGKGLRSMLHPLTLVKTEDGWRHPSEVDPNARFRASRGFTTEELFRAPTRGGAFDKGNLYNLTLAE